MSMVKEVAGRAQELIEIETQRRKNMGAPPLHNPKLSNVVRAAIEFAYELYRDEDDPEKLDIADYIRVRDLALGIA